jgi:hypothetical protein
MHKLAAATICCLGAAMGTVPQQVAVHKHDGAVVACLLNQRCAGQGPFRKIALGCAGVLST